MPASSLFISASSPNFVLPLTFLHLLFVVLKYGVDAADDAGDNEA